MRLNSYIKRIIKEPRWTTPKTHHIQNFLTGIEPPHFRTDIKCMPAEAIARRCRREGGSRRSTTSKRIVRDAPTSFYVSIITRSRSLEFLPDRTCQALDLRFFKNFVLKSPVHVSKLISSCGTYPRTMN